MTHETDMYNGCAEIYNNLINACEFMPPGGERLRGQRTVGQYRAIDLGIFAALLVLMEFLLCKAGTIWFRQEAYVVSLTALITAIVMMRWDLWGAIHAVLGGLAVCLFYKRDASWQMVAVYAVGNLGGLAGLILLKAPGWEKVSGDAGWTLFYGALVLAGMQTGRGLLSLVFGGSPAALPAYYTTEIVTLLFTLVALWIVRRLDGLFENQHHYLRRIHQEMQSEEEGRSE